MSIFTLPIVGSKNNKAMKTNFFLFFILFFFTSYFLSFSQTVDKSKNHTIANGNVKCGNGTTITVLELLAKRSVVLPHLQLNPAIPQYCTKNINEEIDILVEQFRQEDLKNIHAIANNFCSHVGGWIEHQAGECQAGGPPPICSADHWKKVGIGEAIQDFEREQKKVATQRSQQVVKIQENNIIEICKCWVEDIEKQEQEALNLSLSSFKNNQTSNDSYYNIPTTKFPCMSGCPPNYVCVNGFCEKARTTDNSINAVENLLSIGQKNNLSKSVYADKLNKYLLALKSWGGKYLNGLYFFQNHNIVMEAGYNNTNATTMTTGLRNYMYRVEQVSLSVNHLHAYYLEVINSMKGSKYTHSFETIKEDINKEKQSLNLQLQTLNLAHNEISFDCKGCCQPMFNYQHSNIISYASKLINFNYFD